MPDNTDRTSLGLDANVAAALAYFLGWISGAFLLLTERQNRFVRFHALQSVIVFGMLSLAWFLFLSIPLLGWLISFILIPPVSAVVWLLLMFKAYQGERFKLPIVGDIAEQRSERDWTRCWRFDADLDAQHPECCNAPNLERCARTLSLRTLNTEPVQIKS